MGDLPATPAGVTPSGAVAEALAALSKVVLARGHCPIWDGQAAAWAGEAGVGGDPWGTAYLCELVEGGTACRSAGPDREAYTGDDPVGPTVAVGVASTDQISAETSAACAAGDLEACPIWAMQAATAAEYQPILAAACDRGHADSCWLLPSWLERDGAGPDEVRPMLQRACEMGVGVACQSWSRTLADPAAKRAALERGCALGHHWSCEALNGR